MKLYRRIEFAVLASLIIVLGTGCADAQGDSENPDMDQTETASLAVKTVNVTVVEVEPSSFTDFIRVAGQVEGRQDVMVSAEEMGPVSRVLVEKGQRVRRGQVILRLESSVLESQVAEAEAQAELSREQHERQRRLWEDEGIGTEMSYLQARYQADMQAARLNVLRTRLAKTAIRAPTSGVLEDRMVEVGEMATVGTPVARVVAVDSLKVVGGVPERMAGFVHQGDNAVISFDVFPGREFAGQVNFVGATVEAQSRTFAVEVVIANPDGQIKPNMVANMLLERLSLDDVIVVPQEVVIRTADGYQVHVVTERNGETVAETRTVRLGPSYDDRVVVESGLETGDLLVMLGAQMVDDGTRVRVVVEGEG